MSRTIGAGRIMGPAGLAALMLTAAPVTVTPGAAQETGVAQENLDECRRWYAEWSNLDMRPRLGVWISGGDGGGVGLVGVMADGPAGVAGMAEGDVIVSVNGHDLSEPLEGERNADRSLPEDRLTRLVSEATEGEAMTLVVRRDGERITFEVVPEILSPFGGWMPCTDEQRARMGGLGEEWFDPSRRGELLDRIGELTERFRDPEWRLELDSALRLAPQALRLSPQPFGVGAYELPPGGRWLTDRVTHGLDLVELNPGLGAYFGTSEGVLVADVEEDSPLGLRPGDVVVAVDGRVVDDIDELRRILRSYEHDEEIAVRIYRDGAEATVTGTIS